MNELLTLLDCGHPPSSHSHITNGYGVTPDGKKLCYDCCAKREKESMLTTGRALLYLTHNTSQLNPFYELTDWPGHLRFRVFHMRKGRHNIARVRYDVWFMGPDDVRWHGVQYGDNTQVTYCRRVKGKK